MQLARLSHIDILRDTIYKKVMHRKNLMFYDGKTDSLESNIYCKFFYSSPHDPLEFVSLDIYEDIDILKFNNKKIEVFGRAAIIKEKGNNDVGFYESEYGVLLIEEINIRGIDKHSIKFYIDKLGVAKIEKTIDYFEENFCIKALPI